MKVLVIMNRPILDFDSTRNVFLNGIARLASISDIEFHVVLPSCKNPVSVGGVEVVPLMEGREAIDYGLFFLRLISHARDFLRNNRGSIVHHFWSGYRGLDAIDVLALAGLLKDHQFVIGPAEVPHTFDADDFAIYMNRNEGRRLDFDRLSLINERLLVPVTQRLFVSTAKKCNSFIVPYAAAKELYQEYVDERKILVIPHGVNVNKFGYSPLPENHDILFVGNLIHRKNVEFLIKVVAEIRSTFGDIKLHIVGDGPRMKDLARLADSLRLQDSIEFHGKLEESDLVKLYQSCRIFCQPSLSEGFSHVILEAMACGRPVVATETAGSFMVADMTDGFVIPRGNDRLFAVRLRQLLSNHELATRMGRLGRIKIERYFDWDIIAKQYLRMYQVLARSRRV